MNSNLKTFGLVMGANVEALLFLFAAHHLGSWLNVEYPIDNGWLKFTYLAAIIMIGLSWFRMFKSLIKSSQRSDHESR